MGADFLFATLPFAKDTQERRTELRAACLSCHGCCSSCHGCDEERLTALSDEYWMLHDLRDVSTISLQDSSEFLITGGMSYGDDPSESFNTFMDLSAIDPVWDLLEKWSKEDKTDLTKESDRTNTIQIIL